MQAAKAFVLIFGVAVLSQVFNLVASALVALPLAWVVMLAVGWLAPQLGAGFVVIYAPITAVLWLVSIVRRK